MGLANLFSARGRPRRYPGGLCRHENFSGFYHLEYQYTTFYTLSLSWSVSLLLYAVKACLMFRGFPSLVGGSRSLTAQTFYGVMRNMRNTHVPHHSIKQASAAGARKQACSTQRTQTGKHR